MGPIGRKKNPQAPPGALGKQGEAWGLLLAMGVSYQGGWLYHPVACVFAGHGLGGQRLRGTWYRFGP